MTGLVERKSRRMKRRNFLHGSAASLGVSAVAATSARVSADVQPPDLIVLARTIRTV
jgi:hypothetical protein